MRRFLLLQLFAAVTLYAQSPAITQTTVSNGTAVSGPVTCVLSNNSPALPSGVHAACSVSGALSLVMDSVITPGNNGTVGSFTISGVTISWLVTQPTGATAVTWQMTTGTVTKTGVF